MTDKFVAKYLPVVRWIIMQTNPTLGYLGFSKNDWSFNNLCQRWEHCDGQTFVTQSAVEAVIALR